MKKFTYNQCDRINKKISNLDQVINKFYSQRYQDQINEQYGQYMDKYIHVLPTVKKRNCYVNNSKMNSLSYKSKENVDPFLQDINSLIQYQVKKKKQQYFHAYQQLKSHKQLKPLEKSYKKLKLSQGDQQFLRSESFKQQTQNENNFWDSQELQNAQNQTYQVLRNPYSKQQASLLSNLQTFDHNNHMPPLTKLKSQVQLYHTHHSSNPYIKNLKNQQRTKHQNINKLNNQIKSIMNKYSYQFSNEQVSNIIGEKRITLPSYRKKEKEANQFQQQNEIRERQKEIFKKEKQKIQRLVTFQNCNEEDEESQYQIIQQICLHEKVPKCYGQPASNQNLILNQNNKFENVQESSINKQSVVQEIFPVENNSNMQINIFDKININQNCSNENFKKIKKNQDVQYLSQLERRKIDKSLNQYNGKKLKSKLDESNLDKSIDQLNEKIKKVQQKKKQLSIQFKPFKIQNVKKRIDKNKEKLLHVESVRNLTSKQLSISMSLSVLMNQKQQPSFTSLQNKFSSQHLNDKSNLSSSALCSLNDKNRLSTAQTIPITSQTHSNSQGSLNFYLPHSKSNQKKFNKSIILHKKPQKTKNQLQKLLISLNKQVQLDHEFRKMKIGFEFYSSCEKHKDKSKNKWQILTQIYNEKSHQNSHNQVYSQKLPTALNTQQIKSLFSTSIHEHDPFFSLSSNSNTQQSLIDLIQNLLKSYEKTVQHWQTQIKHKFSKKQLIGIQLNNYCSGKNNYFCEEKLDLQGKGYIIIEDFVRFVNMETNMTYRNRDFVLIFQRLLGSANKKEIKQKCQQKQKVSFSAFVNTFCQKIE